MGKVKKKIMKLESRIETLENELIESLTKKDSKTAEINVASHQRKISDARKQLRELN